MDSLATEPENFNSFCRNECGKTISNTPRNMSVSNSNIVHKLFNREVSYNSKITQSSKASPVVMLYFFLVCTYVSCLFCGYG